MKIENLHDKAPNRIKHEKNCLVPHSICFAHIVIRQGRSRACLVKCINNVNVWMCVCVLVRDTYEHEQIHIYLHTQRILPAGPLEAPECHHIWTDSITRPAYLALVHLEHFFTAKAVAMHFLSCFVNYGTSHNLGDTPLVQKPHEIRQEKDQPCCL